MGISVRDLDPALKGAGQKEYPVQVQNNVLHCLRFIIFSFSY